MVCALHSPRFSSLTCDDKTIELHVLLQIVQWSGLAVDQNNVNSNNSSCKRFSIIIKLI